MKSELRAIVAATLVSTLLQAPAWGQPTATNATTPAPQSRKLPPLKLPEIPGETMVEEEDTERPAEAPWEDESRLPPPAQKPESLPIPEGPAIVNANLPLKSRNYFRLEYDGKLVGFASYEVVGRMSLAGESSWILNSNSRLKLGVGSADDAVFESKLMVDTRTLAPSYFKAVQTAGGGSFSVECLYSKSMVAQTNTAGKQQQQHFHSYEGGVPKLLFNNLWGHLDTFPEHYWLLVRSATKGGRVQAYDPILRGGGELIVYAPVAEKWTLDKKELPTLVYPISDIGGTLLARVRVDSRNLDLLEVDEVGSGMSMRKSTPAIKAEVARLKPLDLLPRRTVESNILFPEPEKLTGLEAEIDIKLRGGNLVDHQIAGYRQYFSGEIKEGHMKGRVIVRSVPSDIAHKTKYPFRKEDAPPEELARYLKSSPGVESEWPNLLNKALELTWKSESTFVAARKLMNFTTQIEEGVSLPSARYAMESGVGNPESKALLLVALARAAGLPARTVGGLLYRDGDFVPHHWAEIWLGKNEGWFPFDPTTSEAGRIGAAHIALWESGDIQSIDVRVLNYAPQAARRVAFFNRELAWGVGEERTYQISREGKKIGEEVALVKDLVVGEDEDTFRFQATTRIATNPEKVLENSFELLVNPHGLPVSFHLQGVKGKLEAQKLSFRRGTARLEHQDAKGQARNREIPFSYGTYFTDSRFLSQWALVVGQALDASPDKQPTVGDKLTFQTFLPESLKSQEIVLEVLETENFQLSEEEEIEVRRLETEGGMAFLVNEKNQVVKIEVPEQQLEFKLLSTRFRAD